jgi:hypothetical protein
MSLETFTPTRHMGSGQGPCRPHSGEALEKQNTFNLAD